MKEQVLSLSFLYIASPQQGDLRLSGPPSGQGTGSGARTRDRRVPADLRADSQATVLPTPPMKEQKKKLHRKRNTNHLLQSTDHLSCRVRYAATMIRQPVLLLFGLLMVITVQGIYIRNTLKISLTKPTEAQRGTVPLDVKCTMNRRGAGMRTVQSLSLYRAKIVDGVTAGDFDLVASVTPTGVNNVLGASEISVSGTAGLARVSSLDVKYTSPTDGFCYVYKAIAKGVDGRRRPRSRSRIVKVNSIDGGACVEPQEPSTTPVSNAPTIAELLTKVDQCCVSSEVITQHTKAIELVEVGVNECSQKISDNAEEIQNNAEKYDALDSKVEGLIKLLSIDRTKYMISGIFRGRVYTLSKAAGEFNLEAKNDLCIDAGGYLVEFNDEEEQNFAARFEQKFRDGEITLTGVNCVEEGCKFVNYNSNTPATVKWRKGEPNYCNTFERCTMMVIDGLNDVKCTASGRYMCEIPLYDPTIED
ncbi:C-type lectin domain family 4 member g-like [Plakobranchus ocellatus]|uniref:C-type lectin domain family 4 member g-like n=1 Tax=Plakobranchus ocellatus TaxID=259542 RepID=A0AAV4B8G8_9GAST|nr:C-type lectin domain family 4 member g-like [Plakobranchus ocellatus]